MDVGTSEAEAFCQVHGAEGDTEWIEREQRWVGLTAAHVVFVARSERETLRLVVEKHLCRLLEPALGAKAPRVLASDDARGLQLRNKVHGVHGQDIEDRIFGDVRLRSPAERHSNDLPVTPWGVRFARSLGATLARIHIGVDVAEARQAGLTQDSLDLSTIDAAVQRLDEPALRAAWPHARAFAEAFAALPVVVVHGDPWHLNLFADARGDVSAVIDLDSSRLAPAASDLRYGLSWGPRFATHMLEAYGDVAPPVERELVERAQILHAFEHLASVHRESPRYPRMVEWALAACSTYAPRWR